MIDYLATVGWPVVCYSGAEMWIKGGRSVFGPEHEEVLAVLDRAGVFNAIQLGEWGYYFHNLAAIADSRLKRLVRESLPPSCLS